jgi:hypothetical protein
VTELSKWTAFVLCTSPKVRVVLPKLNWLQDSGTTIGQ